MLSLVGLFFSLTGAIGVLRMPDVYSRIQCTSKVITMGAIPALLAVAVSKGLLSQYGVHALIVAFLLLVLNPAASHALGRAAYKTGIRQWSGAVADEPRERGRS
ncbi:monovalent cation/H(+) antiporter subunit G [Kribbella jejuensis]|uniref:Multicomponent Na+:H+ antiporter subunit G n=1 Tax=Kribbella jejuensis TaxID=236068 RepID=A0A542EL82_9ACTN|nr:multicomponent Na+:H+ antiporter subunit G [Kribbella jejuensis]